MSAPGGPAWWLTEASTLRALDGPFRRRVEIEDAEPPADESWEDLVVDEVYGVVDVDGRVAQRASPEDKAFEAHLSEQLDRIRDETGRRPAGAGGELALEVAAALVEAGFVLHDCTHQDPGGGVCLTLVPDADEIPAVAVEATWSAHDRMPELRTYSYGDYQATLETMNAALSEVLRVLGFQVEQLGQPPRWVVTG